MWSQICLDVDLKWDVARDIELATYAQIDGRSKHIPKRKSRHQPAAGKCSALLWAHFCIFLRDCFAEILRFVSRLKYNLLHADWCIFYCTEMSSAGPSTGFPRFYGERAGIYLCMLWVQICTNFLDNSNMYIGYINVPESKFIGLKVRYRPW